jgi:hypothetical protein
MARPALIELYFLLAQPVSPQPAIPYLAAWTAAAAYALLFLGLLAANVGFGRRLPRFWPALLVGILAAAIVGRGVNERLPAQPFYVDLRGAPPEIQAMELLKRVAKLAVKSAHAAPDRRIPADRALFEGALVEAGAPLPVNYSFRFRKRPWRLVLRTDWTGPQIFPDQDDLPGTLYLCLDAGRNAFWATAVVLLEEGTTRRVDVLPSAEGKPLVVTGNASDPEQ